MGSCSSKSRVVESHKTINTKAEIQNSSEEAKKAAQDQLINSRKHLKQKAAVADSRLRHSSTDALDAPTAIKTDKRKGEKDIILINQSLLKHFIFNSLTTIQRKAIIESMKFLEIEPQQIVFEQGSKGAAFFIIASGQVEVIINEKKVTVLKFGDSFGELALLHDTFRSATVKTLIKTSL